MTPDDEAEAYWFTPAPREDDTGVVHDERQEELEL